MFRNIRHAVLAALPFSALSIYAVAQSANPPAPGSHANFFQHMLQKMDTNGDGRISLDEYLSAAGARFKNIDSQNKGSIDAADIAGSKAALARIDRRANAMVRHLDSAGNGYVTPDEFVAAAQKRFGRLDKNGDGRLTPDELATRWGHTAVAQGNGRSGKFAAAGQQRFEQLDINHDGVITADEYVAAAKALYAQLDTGHTGKLTAAEVAASPKTQERAVHVADRLIRHMDTNGDGVVSQDEFMAAARTRFTKVDKNGDGFIDADEIGRHWAGKGHKNQG